MERGTVHLASFVHAAQHGEGRKGGAEKEMRTQEQSAIEQYSGYRPSCTGKDRKANQNHWQKKEAVKEKKFVWKCQDMRMTAFDVRLKTGINRKENEENNLGNK